MNIDMLELLNNLTEAKIYAGAEFERLCNDNKHTEACIFQAIRDSLGQNISLLQSYLYINKESEDK